MDPLVLKENQVHQVMDVLLKEMYLGLNRDENKRKQTSLQMENTYVRTLLDGTGDPWIHTLVNQISHFTLFHNHSSSLAILIQTVFHERSRKFAFFDRNLQTN